jgi:hypothetical protein
MATTTPTGTSTDDRTEPIVAEPPGTEAEVTAAGPTRTFGGGAAEGEAAPQEPPSPRLAVAVGFPVVASAVMVGGIFKGIAPRPIAAVAGILGVALAYGLARARRSPVVTNLLVVGGLFAIGLLMLFPSLGALGSLRTTVRDAIQSGNVLRPPVDFLTGWKVIVGWLLATIGFAATWVALVFKKPALGVLLPLPLAGFAAISVPDSAQVASGLAVLVLFAVALGILSSEQATADSDDDSAKPTVAYEVRKVLKSVPVIVLLVIALVFGQKYVSVLFPKPIIDPAQEPQKPKTQPLSTVEDRVLYEVESEVSGPWRLGSLDVYDGEDWRLPPFAQNQLDGVPRSGIVDTDLQAGLRARFTIAGLGGAVLPGLPNTVGVIAEGPKLAFDKRNGNIRLVSGQVTPGLTYTVAAAALPSVDDLKAIVDPLPRNVRQFTKVPDAPPAVVDLLQRAAEGRPSKWEQFDFARTFVLENVTASGLGTPKSITPERVQEILATTLKASPYEIVATQALLARWLGIPSRIGYGFDGGDLVDGKLQVRPRNGAAFPEVYFPGFKWLPVIGVPKKAEPTVGSDPSTQKLDPSILPSDDIAVQIFMPVLVPPGSVLGKQIAVSILIAVPILLFFLLLYILFPAFRKARLRGKRRDAAQAAGLRARVALAYAEWRDWATDFGYSYPTETPLMYLDRFIEDEEHTELAWLTTRVLWGDLRDDPNPMYATIAEELSRSLRRRLAATQPATVRAVAFVSRLSLRNPYAPETDLTPKKDRKPATPKEQDREPVPA